MITKTFQLGDGRMLGYAEFGAPEGIPVFSFHGTPGSRLMPEEESVAAAGIGIRLIVPERPGYGFSDARPDCQLLDWADDVVELADALNLPRFGIMGSSGGAPYAIGCAYKIPQRLTKVAAISSSAPLEAFDPPPALRTIAEIEANAQSLAQRIHENPLEFVNRVLPDATESDKEFMIATLQESFRSGIQGYVSDIVLLDTRPWGIPLGEIEIALEFWHGEHDEIKNARYLSERIPNSILHILAGAGHWLPLADMETIFRSFVE